MSGNQDSAHVLFEQEAASIRSIIYDLINGGNTEAAKQVLEQYSLLNPTDPELITIKSMLYFDGSAKAVEAAIPDEYGILNGIETVFILSGIITRRTGYIDSVLRKIKLMEDMWNYKPLLLTCIHNIDNHQALTWLKTADGDQASIGANTRIQNVFEYFQGSYAEGLSNIAVYAPVDDGNRYVEVSDGVFEVYANDVCIRKEHYSGYAGSLRMVRHYSGEKKVSDTFFDEWGYLNYVREYDPKDENRFGDKYYTTGGDLCIEAFYECKDDGCREELLVVYDTDGKALKKCKGSAELAAFFLEKIITDDKFYLLVVEDGLMSKAATMISSGRKNVAKCAVVHSIFLNDAYDLKSDPQMYYKYLCENHKEFDGIVMLTDSAREDFLSIYGERENIFVIPHPYPYEISQPDFKERDPLKAAIVARLDPLKQVVFAVDIFSDVVKEVPEAKLEIFGRGSEEENIRKRIKELGLESNITFMGYTDEPLSAFRSAALSIFTSAAEGFGLTLVESICNGCPAFAFDIKYGPSEIIIDGQTGFLIPRFDKELFARKLLEFFKDEKMRQKMSENCYADTKRFSTDKFMDNWFDMTGHMRICYE